MTPAQLKTHIATIRPLAAQVLRAVETAQVLREKVDAIKAEILEADVYMSGDLSIRGRTVPARRITKPNEDWLMHDEDSARYFAILDARVRSEVEGAAALDSGYCPALVAEDNQVKAEQALLEATAPFCGVTANQINQSPATRQKWLDTWLDACTNL